MTSLPVVERSYTVNFLGPFWPQKWGQIFDPEMAPCWGAILAPVNGAEFSAPFYGAVLAPNEELNFSSVFGAISAPDEGPNL